MTKWVLGPPGQCVTLIANATADAASLERAVVALSGQGPLLQLARSGLIALNRDQASVDRLLAEQPYLSTWASDQIASDYRSIRVTGIVSLWTAVEVAVEDTVCLALMNDSAALASALASLARPPNLPTPFDDDGARRVFKRLEWTRSAQQSVGLHYADILQVVGIVIALSLADAITLAELNYARNCLLHRGGIIDDRAKIEAPRLVAHIGKPIPLTRSDYLRYFDAASAFAQALLTGALASSHAR